MVAGNGMETIEVVARFDQEGNLTPVSFSWQARQYRVESIGRRWEDEAGQHFMVMVPGEQVYELIFITGEMRWRLKRPGRTWV